MTIPTTWRCEPARSVCLALCTFTLSCSHGCTGEIFDMGPSLPPVWKPAWPGLDDHCRLTQFVRCVATWCRCQPIPLPSLPRADLARIAAESRKEQPSLAQSSLCVPAAHLTSTPTKHLQTQQYGRQEIPGLGGYLRKEQRSIIYKLILRSHKLPDSIANQLYRQNPTPC